MTTIDTERPASEDAVMSVPVARLNHAVLEKPNPH